MKRFLFFTIFLFCFSIQYAQFEFSGYINKEFKNSTAYLNIVDNYNKSGLFLMEQIIQSSQIDSLGKFSFSGNFLSEKNEVYKIYLDNCNEKISDSKHLLNQCEESISIIFIANNNDQIHFPLNDLSQMFCSLDYSSEHNIAIYKIDSVQEELLIDLPNAKSDTQRKIIYKNYFEELQEFSKSLNEPLAELYAFHLYSEDQSFSREYYFNNLKKSEYYNNLLENLEQVYPSSTHASYYKNELINDQYPLLQSKNKTFKYLVYGLTILLLISLITNYILVKKSRVYYKKKKNIDLDYKTVLSPQEQKVFELMQEKLSNKEIAKKLFISLSTVKTHINNIYTKLSISSRNEIHRYF